MKDLKKLNLTSNGSFADLVNQFEKKEISLTELSKICGGYSSGCSVATVI